MICVFFNIKKQALSSLNSMTALLNCDMYFSSLKAYEEYICSLPMGKRNRMVSLFF